MEEIKKSFPQTPYSMMYPYMPIAMTGMQSETVKTEKTEQMETQTKAPEELDGDKVGVYTKLNMKPICWDE